MISEGFEGGAGFGDVAKPSGSPEAAAPRSMDSAIAEAISAGLAHLRRLDSHAAAEIDQLRRRSAERPTIVVVGETKRGKSSLINALLGVPHLSPVDAAVATSAYLEFEYAKAPSASADVPGEVGPVAFPMAQLRSWVTGDGTDGMFPGNRRPPRSVRVSYPAPLLRRVRLVDTPGVGGLDSMHAEIALDAVEKATALLFVVDASTPLTRPELDFLIKASKRVNDVIFAITKIDAYPGWQVVLDDDVALLQSHASRFAEAAFFGVSSRLAELAATMSSVSQAGQPSPSRHSAGPDPAQLLAAQSGVSPLREALVALSVDNARLLSLTNVLRAVRSELVTVDASIGDQLRTADPDTTTIAALKEERLRFASQKRKDARTWSLTLAAETRRARTDATAHLRTQIQQLQESYLTIVESANGRRITGLPLEIDQALHGISMHISADLECRFRGIGQRVLEEVFTEQELRMVLSTIHAGLRTASAPKARREASNDQSLVITGAAGAAVIAGRGAAAGGALAIGSGGALASFAIPVIGIGVGLAAGAFLLYRRHVSNDRRQAGLWLKEVLSAARAAMADEISHRFTDLELALTVSLDRAVERRMEQLDAQIGQIDTAMAHDKAERARRKRELQADRDAIRARVRQLDDVLAQVRNLPGRPRSIPS